MDDKKPQEENQLEAKKTTIRKKKPLPPFLKSIRKPLIWKKSVAKGAKKAGASQRLPSQESKVPTNEARSLNAPNLYSRQRSETAVSSSIHMQQKGHYVTMAKTSFGTIVVSLFCLGFLFFASGFFVAIYFFKESVSPSVQKNSWINEEKRKLGRGLEETVKEEIWAHAGNTPLTREMLSTQNSGALSLSSQPQREQISSDASRPSGSRPLTQPEAASNAGSPAAGASLSPSPEGPTEPTAQGDKPRDLVAPETSLSQETQPSVSLQDAAAGSLVETKPVKKVSTPVEVQDVIQNPKAVMPSYHAAPLRPAVPEDGKDASLESQERVPEQIYTLNFGIFPTKDKALDRLKKIKAHHGDGRIEEKKTGKTLSFMVVTGGYKTQEEAQRALKNLPKEEVLLFSPKVQLETRETHNA